MESIIGKQYAPQDNTYSVGEDGKCHYLAGTWDTYGQMVTISSEPYKEFVHTYGGDELETFIRVQDKKGMTHRVLYYSHGVEGLLPEMQYPLEW